MSEDYQPAFKKPGEKIKKKKKTSRFTVREIEPPEEKHCRWCDIETGTESYRHSEDPEIKFLVGGGIMADKINDRLSVWACDVCDTEMSTKPFFNPAKIEKTLFDIIFLKWQNKWKIGIIKTWLL
jgi:hypothetical protein